ncbi:MAG: hypothetical protein ABR499_15315 [Gemmatimonadaceae bacterium]
MRTHFSRGVVALTLVGVACARATTTGTTTTTTAQPATQPQTTTTTTISSSLPAGRALIDRYVQVVGGREAVTRHNTIRSVGMFEMPAAGMKGEFTLVQVAPNKMAMTMNLPGMGQMWTGFDGTTGWSVNPMQGPRVLEGRELDQLRDESGPGAMLRAADRVRSAETVELTTLGGQQCYKVKITYHSGRESFDCYSPETGLLVGMIQRQESPMGSVEITTLVSDWKEFGGLKVPTRLRAQMMGQEMVQTIDRVEFDRPEDVKAVEMPKQVKPLVKKP